MAENILYADEDIEVGYLPDSPEDNYIAFTSDDPGRQEYLLQRGIVRELAETPRGDGLAQKLNNVNDLILLDARQRGLHQSDVHVAICQAYREQEERYQRFATEMRADQDREVDGTDMVILGGKSDGEYRVP